MGKEELSRYLVDKDSTEVYETEKLALQVLSSTNPPKEFWVLKDPSDSNHIKYLHKVFPDANFVHLHRNPLQTVPSFCSLTQTATSTLLDSVLIESYSRVIANYMIEGERNVYRYRLSLPRSVDSKIFHDVEYQEFIKDPIGTVQSIYNHFGYSFDDEFVHDMRLYLDENPKGKHGVHNYTLEQFKLDKNYLIDQYNSIKQEYLSKR